MIFSLLLASAPAGAVPAQNSTAPSGSNVASATRPEDSGPKALGADNHFLREGNATAETDISGAGAVSGEIPPHNSTALGSSSPNEPETPIFSWGGYFKGIGALFLILAALWGVDSVPEKPGLTAVEMFQAAADGQIKALWILCTNPAQSLPDQNTVRRALQRAEFVVVQEAFASSETCAYADLLLPAAPWGEKEGTVTNSERRISRVRAAVAPACGCVWWTPAWASPRRRRIRSMRSSCS